MKNFLKKFINAETLSYIIFGVLTTIVSFVCAGISKKIFEMCGFSAQVIGPVSTVISWICAVTFAFVTNRIWVFKSKAKGFKAVAAEAFKFYGGRLTTLLIELIIMTLGYSVFHFNYWLTKIFANVIVLILNYVISKFVIFNTEGKTSKERSVSYASYGSTGVLFELTRGRAVYIISFAIPLIIMVAIFYMRSIFPFGDACYLRSDMYHQYCPFFSELWEKLRNGESLFYTWDIGMGSNFLAIYGYYLSSPTNWFISIFPQKSMIEIMNVIIILKLCLSSLTCTYYLCQHTRKRHIGAAVFGMFYSLSAFIAAYSWNIMWLDCLLLLPLVVLGLERLVNEGKGLLYAVTLGFTILSNYYIAIMVCISMVIYFVVIMISRPVHEDKTRYAKSILHFALYSLIAGAFAAIVLLPEIYALKYTASGNFSFPKTLTRYFSFVTMIERQFMNVPVHTGLEHLPNIYCGVFVFLLLPLFVMAKKVPAREKISKIVALVIFFTAFNLNIPNFIWHGFHYPNSLPCRQSFIYIFLLLSMCYDAFIELKNFKKGRIVGCFWGVMLFLLYVGNTLTDDSQITFKILYVNVFFIAIYGLAFFLMNKKKACKTLWIYVILAVSLVECTINMNVTGYSTTTRSAYFRDYDSIEYLMDKYEINADSSDFYRTTKYRGYRSKNDAAWHNYQGGSVFSSTAYAAMSKFYGYIGLEHSTNAYSLNGATPLLYSMFGVKYLFSNAEIGGSDIYSLVDTNDGEYLYKNNYALPVAFMVPSDFKDLWECDSNSNPFVIQNQLAEYAAGVTGLYTRLTFDDYDTSADIIVEEDTYLYMYIMNKSISTIAVTVDDEPKQTFTGINHGRMIDLGFVKAGSVVNVKDNKTGSGESLQMYAYSMDIDKYRQVCKALGDEGLDVTHYDETSITGTITAKSNGLMFTSIPYDKSFTLYVDGVETPFTSIGNNALIAVNLTAGTHSIEFKYVPDGYYKGLFLTVISIVILAAFLAFRLIVKKEITEEGALLALYDLKNKRKSERNEE